MHVYMHKHMHDVCLRKLTIIYVGTRQLGIFMHLSTFESLIHVSGLSTGQLYIYIYLLYDSGTIVKIILSSAITTSA